MVFDKVLAKVGIGSAEVDTRLDQSRLQPGQEFSAQVVVQGGETDQEIDELVLKLRVEMREEAGEPGRTKTIDTWRVHDGFTIREGEERVIDFQGRLHPETPVTEWPGVRRNLSKVWLQTGADIDNAIDPKDKDYLTVEPTRAMSAMLEAVENAGFRPNELTIDPDRIQTEHVTADLACDQEFVLKHTDGRWGVEEVEIHFVPREDTTHVLVEFDRHHGRETFESMTVDNADPDSRRLQDEFETLLRRHG